MYQPDHFRVEDVAQMHALMRTRPFAALISCGSSGLYATHLPTVLKDEGACGVIECHLARANPHWKDLAEGDLSGSRRLHYAQLVSVEDAARQGRADVELCGRPRLWPSRGDAGQRLAAPPRKRAHRSAGSHKRCIKRIGIAMQMET